MIIEAGHVVTANGLLAPGWVQIEGDRIIQAGGGQAPSAPDERHPNMWLAPGYVDVHVHGGGGSSFSTTSDREISRVLAAHRARGTTTMVASLVTASPDELRRQVAALAARVHIGDLAGIHLEGPWLNPERKGAHEAGLLADPDLDLIAELLDAANGAIRMVTLAPELPNGVEATELLVSRGVVVAVGHTGATYAECQAAINAGARGATHLFNAMPPLHHRNPGPILALLTDPRVHVELVFDNVHVDPELAVFALRTAGARGVLVTDAMAAAGQPDGHYRLGSLDVTVTDGVAVLTGSDTIAGSTLTLDAAVRNAHAAGLTPVEAIQAATCQPADYLDLADVGRLEAGFRADMVMLDNELRVRRVMMNGVWL